MRISTLLALSLSFSLVACQSQLPEALSSLSPADNSLRSSGRETLSVDLSLPAGFFTQFADSSRLAFVRISVAGQGLSGAVDADGPIFQTVSGSALAATISNLTPSEGAIRVVTVQGYDSQQLALPGFELKGWYVSHGGGTSLVSVSRRGFLIGKIIDNLMAAQSPLLSKLDLSGLQAVLDTLTGYDAQTGGFAVSPNRFDLTALINALPADGSLPTAGALSAAALGGTGTANIAYSTPNSKTTAEEVVFSINDPGSRPVALPRLSAGTGNVSFSGIQPGNWTLEARTQKGQLLTSTTATVGSGGGVSFGNLNLMLTGIQELKGEMQVNAYTTGHQSGARIAADQAGNYVIVWASSGQDGDQLGIYGQRYNASDVAQGGEFRVNTYTTGNQSNPAVAMDGSGNFVVSWDSYGQDGSETGIYAQRYSAAGEPLGSEFRVNTYTNRYQSNPSVAMDEAGDTVIAWQSYGQDGDQFGIYAQRYNAAGVAQNGEFHVSTYTTNSQTLPSVAISQNGDFVIAWQSFTQDGSGSGVYGQRFDAAGIPQAGEFRINSYTTGSQSTASVGMDQSGNFVVAWTSNNQDSSTSQGIFAQRYNATGVAQGSEFQVNTYTSQDQKIPALSMDKAGDFAIVWSSLNQDGDIYEIFGQRYNATGVEQGREFHVNTFTTGSQKGPAVALDSAGDFWVTWQSSAQDGSGYGIYRQRYDALNQPQ